MSSTEPIKPEVDELFKAVNSEVTWLHTIWELFIQLYGSSDENFEIMNSTAPQFFAILKTMLFDELVMTLNRLTDPASTFGKANASLERLIEQIDQEAHAKLYTSLRSRLKTIRINYDAFRTWRDKKVSHNDLAIAIKEDASLPGIARGQTEQAIGEIAGFMNEYSLAMYGGEQKYVPFMVARGDAKALLQSLKEGLEHKAKEA